MGYNSNLDYNKIGVKSRELSLCLHKNVQYAAMIKYGTVKEFLKVFNAKYGFKVTKELFYVACSDRWSPCTFSPIKLVNMCELLELDYLEAQKRNLFEGLPRPARVYTIKKKAA